MTLGVSVGRRVGVPILALLLTSSGCTIPPRPYPTAIPADDHAFTVCAEQLRVRYGRLPVIDRAAFRLQTDWLAVQGRGRVLRQRATLFRADDGSVAILIEESVLRSGWSGLPEWSPPRVQPELADELARDLEAALGA